MLRPESTLVGKLDNILYRVVLISFFGTIIFYGLTNGYLHLVCVNILVRIESNANVISSFQVDDHLNCFSHCCHQPTCTGFNFKQQLSRGSDVNCVLVNNIEDDLGKSGEGEWTFYKSILV